MSLSLRIPLAAFFIASAAANAGECRTDADCASTEFCALSDCASCDPDDANCVPSDCSNVGACVALDPTCTSDADCAPGQACAHNDCAEACDPADAECTDRCTGGICVDVAEPPPSCATDSDCSSGDVCIIAEVDCGGAAEPCDPTTGECPEVPPESDCGSGSVGYCGPAYLGECEVDADCGAGFTCESESISTCSCAAPDDGSEPACECEEPANSDGPGICVLELVPCAVDADCSNDFICHPAPSAGAPEPDCGSNEETDCGGDDAAEPVSGYCAPADYVGTPGGEVSIGGEEARNEDTEDDVADDDVETFDGDFILCASNDAATPRALLPFAALALFLRRRRR